MFKFVQAVKAAVMAVGISIVCLLPPIVHFVTGPLGPAIGGYFAGNRMRLTGGQAALVGLILGISRGCSNSLALCSNQFDSGFFHADIDLLRRLRCGLRDGVEWCGGLDWGQFCERRGGRRRH